jgi:Tc toxin complex TcA C-terminal TcB-binding domain
VFRYPESYLDPDLRDDKTPIFNEIVADRSAAPRESGACDFDLAEILFDVVYPGQYRRILKSVRITIPGVTGPYTNVGAKVSLTKSSVRADPKASLAKLDATLVGDVLLLLRYKVS